MYHISRKTICKIFKFHRSVSYYKSRKTKEDDIWLNRIVEVLKLNPDYGIHRLYLYFKLTGVKISKFKIRRICRTNGIVAKTKLNKPPTRDKRLPSSGIPNLVKDLQKQKSYLLQVPNYIWSGDFSYFKIAGTWYYYLATVIDNCTKEILGFSLSNKHTTSLIKNALKMALVKNIVCHIFHSDQGSEYTSLEYQSYLLQNQILASNSKKSSPWENGTQESFYGKFKDELKLYRLNYCYNYMEAYNLIVSQIDYYNNRRIHTTIENTPSQFYAQYLLNLEEKKVS